MQWYDEISADSALTQGTIIFGCPVVQVTDLALQDVNEDEWQADVETVTELRNVVVVSQACDVQKGHKGTNKLVVVDLIDLKHVPEWGRVKEIYQGKIPRFCLLGNYEGGASRLKMNYQVADFSNLFVLPAGVMNSLKEKFGPRLQLKTPHRELLSQRFANYYARIGLPDHDHITEAAVKEQYDEIQRQKQAGRMLTT